MQVHFVENTQMETLSFNIKKMYTYSDKALKCTFVNGTYHSFYAEWHKITFTVALNMKYVI